MSYEKYYSEYFPDIPTDCDTNITKYNINDIEIDDNCSSEPIYSPDGTQQNGQYCYQREMCKNKVLTDKMTELNYITNGSHIRYTDSEKSMSLDVIYTINIGVGILITSILILKNIKN